MSNVTKRALEQSLKNLLLKKPLTKITIGDITEDCGINRMTFYYHFKDIYDLVEWACLEDARRALDEKKTYDSLYFMNMEFTENFLRESCVKILKDPACGKVFRIKGFQKLPDNTWIAVNATHQKTEIHPIPNGQAILIVIGEGLHPEAIESYWGKSKP